MPIIEVIITYYSKYTFPKHTIIKRNGNDKFWHKNLATWVLTIHKEKEVEKSSQPLFSLVPRAGVEPARWGTTEGF